MTSGRPVIGRPGLLVIATATVSRLADNAAAIALVLLIIARTHDPRLAGLVVGAFTVPTLVTGPLLGAYLDRARRKRPLFAVNQVALAMALGAVLVLAGRVPGWLLAAITTVWKVSIHCAVASGSVTMLALLFGPWLAPGYLLVALTAWSRVELKDHTTAQVITGAVLGAAAAALTYAIIPR